MNPLTRISGEEEMSWGKGRGGRRIDGLKKFSSDLFKFIVSKHLQVLLRQLTIVHLFIGSSWALRVKSRPYPSVAFSVGTTHTNRVNSFWMLFDLKVWAPSWNG